MKYKFRMYYLYYLGRLVALKLRILPLNISLYIGKILGRLAFWIIAKYRNITIENLQIAFGREKNEGEINQIAIRVFENLGKVAVEIINFSKINKSNIDRFVRIVNADIITNAFKAGKGVIILT